MSWLAEQSTLTVIALVLGIPSMVMLYRIANTLDKIREILAGR